VGGPALPETVKVRAPAADTPDVASVGEEGPALQELRLRLVHELRDRLVDQAISMPLGNQPALSRVAELCRNPGTSAAVVAAEAALDEGFAATILRVANSAAVAGISKVEDLATAVTRLGLGFVECLAVSAPSLRLLATPSDALSPARVELHRHAVRTGVLSRALATDGVGPDHALAAGLVHNLGLSVLSIHARSGFKRLLDAAEIGEQLPEAELRLFGFTHAELGGLLAESWSFPDSLVRAIREHADDLPSTQLAALVQTADRLVRSAGIGIEPPVDPSPAVASTAGLDLEDAREVAARLIGPGRAPAGARSPLTSVLDSLV
jgi:HD-like signal output (HDOD) protein